MTRRRNAGSACLTVAAAALLLAVTLTGCASTPAGPKPPAARLTRVPEAGATSVGVTTPVTINVADGSLLGVEVASARGSVVGTFHPNPAPPAGIPFGPLLPASFTTADALRPNTPYTVSVAYVGRDGKRRDEHYSFTTGAPADVLNAKLSPDSQTVGVGMPIRIELDHAIPKERRAAFVERLHVVANPPVEGAWHWFSGKSLHYRPKDFWPAKAAVDVAADLSDFDAGGGVWGTKEIHTHFTIGDSHVSIVSIPAHTMTVLQNGTPIKVLPVSTGRDQYPTHGGIHVVSDKKPSVVMDSSAIGISPNAPGGYHETVKWSTRISDSGEFVHSAPWSAAAQGNANVSHGCVNVSDADGQWYFDYALIGDVVRVDGSPTQLEPTNGLGDWQIPWAQWAN